MLTNYVFEVKEAVTRGSGLCYFFFPFFVFLAVPIPVMSSVAAEPGGPSVSTGPVEMPDNRLGGLPGLLVCRLPLSIPSRPSVRYMVGGVVNVSAVRADETALLSSLVDRL